MTFLIYLYIVLFPIICVAIFIMGIENIITVIKRRAPTVSAGRRKCDSVIKQISIEMPAAKTIFDIGSGYGQMAINVAKAFPDATVTGIEVMPTPYIYSVIRGMFRRNVKFVFGDAFKFLDAPDKKFDIGIAYLLTPEMKDVENFVSKFKILLAVDFPLPDIAPDKKIKLHKDHFAQHHLYVYKFL